MTNQWKSIDDSKVVTVWRCPDCSATVDWPIACFLDGTPTCECTGCDMDWIDTKFFDRDFGAEPGSKVLS